MKAKTDIREGTEPSKSATEKATLPKVMLTKSELSIWLDSYDDIFSDFDPRPYSERALSDDFINEAKKMARENMIEDLSLKLLVPENLRNKTTEETIVKSLHSHFRKFAHQIKEEMTLIRNKGIKMSLLGIVIMVGAAYVINLPEKNFWINTLRVIMEPGGWFLVWTGLDQIFYSSRKKQSEYDFMSRMGHAEIKFLSF